MRRYSSSGKLTLRFFSHQNLNNVQNVCWWLVRGLILANIQRIFRFCRHSQIWRISWAFGWHGLLKEFPNTSRHRPQVQVIRNNWICVWCSIDASNSISVNKDSFHFRASMFFLPIVDIFQNYNRWCWHMTHMTKCLASITGCVVFTCCWFGAFFIFHNIWDNPLHYTILHSTTLQLQLHNYTPLRSTTLHYTKLHYTTLHYTTLHYTTLHYTTLPSTTLHYITLHSTPLHYNYNYNYTTTLHYTPLHSITLHYTTLHYTTLHYTTLHYTAFHYTPLH